MGATCCCLRDYDDFTAQNTAVYRNCIFLRCFLQNFVHLYASYFQSGEQHVLVSSSPGATSVIPMGSLDNSLVDMFRPPPLPLPYDANPRYMGLQQDEHVLKGEKGSSHSHGEAEVELLATSEVDDDYLDAKNKWTQMQCEEDSTEQYLKSSTKSSTIKSADGYSHICVSSEDEDVCPTCLDEYSLENPKIVTECAHHFHLGCIFEWMERSDKCPVCGKVMAFNEAS